jgi:hypothetical protein
MSQKYINERLVIREVEKNNDIQAKTRKRFPVAS